MILHFSIFPIVLLRKRLLTDSNIFCLIELSDDYLTGSGTQTVFFFDFRFILLQTFFIDFVRSFCFAQKVKSIITRVRFLIKDDHFMGMRILTV